MSLKFITTLFLGKFQGGGSATEVALLSVTTAPSGSFVVGSKYYDSTEKKIYTAITANTWTGATESDPQVIPVYYLYDGATYYWDGDSLEKKDISGLAKAVVITTDATSTTPSLTLASYTEKRYTYASGLTSLTIALPATIDSDFNAAVVFKSRTTATTFSTDSAIKYSGDNVASNVFTPAVSTTYNLTFWYDGVNTNCVVRGV